VTSESTTRETGAKPASGLPRQALFRFLLLALLVAAGFAALRWTPLAGYASGPQLKAAFESLRQAWWAPALLIAVYLLASPIGMPAVPPMLAGAVVFGAAQGTLYNLIGLFLGAASTYALGRFLGRDFVRHLAGKRLKKVERGLAQRGFWGLVAIRFVPGLPFAVTNYCAALAGVPPGLFLATTAVGLIPAVFIYTYFFAALAHAAEGRRSAIWLQLGVAVVFLILLTLLPPLLQGRRRRARYRALVEQRQVRRKRRRAD
jgi:phospholipase D1/2